MQLLVHLDTSFVAASYADYSAALPNIALGKTTTQSSTAPGGSAVGAYDSALAVDGHFGGKGKCAMTGTDKHPWWRVDLGSPMSINSVIVWRQMWLTSNTEDVSTIHNFKVRITNNGTWNETLPQCGGVHQVSRHLTNRVVDCGGQVGRYVFIDLITEGQLALCEVQIQGRLLGASQTLKLSCPVPGGEQQAYLSKGAGQCCKGQSNLTVPKGASAYVNVFTLDTDKWPLQFLNFA